MPLLTRPGARALNKPLLILGIDRKLAGLAFLLSVMVGANDGFVPKASALVLFVSLWALGRRLTRRDPNIFLVLNQIRKQKALYDPMKHEHFRLIVERRTE
jgi:type IV secretory pathway TrbD component